LDLVGRFLASHGRSLDELGAGAKEALMAHAWPGNVRELKNTIARSVALSGAGPLRLHVEPDPHLVLNAAEPEAPRPGVEPDPPANAAHRPGVPGASASFPDPWFALPLKEAKRRLDDEFEQAYLVQLLERHAGRIASAAREAGIARAYLHALIRRHGLTRQAPRFERAP
jgi:DNA-binding NtrC family response regulator